MKTKLESLVKTISVSMCVVPLAAYAQDVRMMSFDDVYAAEDVVEQFQDEDGVLWTYQGRAEMYDESDDAVLITEDDFYTGEEDFEDDNTWVVLFDDGREYVSEPIEHLDTQDADVGPPTNLSFPFQQVFPPLNTIPPYKWATNLSHNRGTCSAAVVGRRVLATAAHCLHSGRRSGRWFQNFRVIIGRTGLCSSTTNCPLGQYDVQYAFTPGSWRGGVRRRWPVDRGVIVMHARDRLPTNYGAFDYRDVSASTLRRGTVVTTGYPGNPGGGTMWYDICGTARVLPRKFFHDCTSRGGQSGSGIWLRGTRTLVGVISGYGAAGNNRATRMNGDFVGMLNKQRRNHP